MILPKLNEKDMVEVPAYATQGMTIHYVSHVEEVLKLALTETKEKAKGKVEVPNVLRTKSKKATEARV